MPSAIELDLKHWVRVVPAEGKSQVVTCRSFACFRSGLLAPPELATEGTELTTGSTFTIEGSGNWFIAKKAATTEEQLPSLLEVAPATVEAINASALAENSVTEPKIKAEAVAASKAKVATVPTPAAAESLTAVAGTAGVTRVINFAYTAKAEANAKVKLIHNLGTTAVTVTAWTTAAKIPSEIIDFGVEAKGSIEKVKAESANEVLVTLKGAVPGAKEEFIYSVTG